MQFSPTAEDMHALASEHDERYDSPNPEWDSFLQEQEDKFLESFLKSAMESAYELWLSLAWETLKPLKWGA